MYCIVISRRDGRICRLLLFTKYLRYFQIVNETMAQFRNITINLDSPRGVYYPGQVLSGSLEIHLEAPLTFSVIYVKFLGEACVKWTEEESEEVNGNKRYKMIEYVGNEEYFKGSQLLAGSYGSVVNLNPGKYMYKFQYQIPRKAPSSFKGERGEVRYTVNGHIEFQGQDLFREEIVKHFEIVAPFDLNKGNECVREPIEMEFEEVLAGCGCMCSSEPVTVRVRLPASAYCPGQVIPVDVAVENNSSVEISFMLFDIITREKYKSQRPVAQYVQPEAVLTTARKGSIMSGYKRNFTVELVVPDIIAPNLEDCSIIDVGYFFRITVKLSGCNDDLQDEAEICLGLIPLTETVEGTYVHPMAHSLPEGPIPTDPIPTVQEMQNSSQLQTGFPTVPNGTSIFVQVNQQVISSDPSQNYQMGFKASYPAGSELPPAFNPQFGQLNDQQQFHDKTWVLNDGLKIQMDDLTKTNQNFAAPNLDGFPVQGYGFASPILGANNSFVPRSRSPAPSAPPL